MRSNFKIAVVGGGITGLSCAYYLSKSLQDRSFEIDLFEKTDRLGGVINTKASEQLLLEGGPDSFFTAKSFCLDLVNELGLNSSLIETNTEFRQSLLAQKGKLHPLPAGFVLFAPSLVVPFLQSNLLSFGGKLRASMELFVPPKLYGDEESVSEFVTRRFGQESLEKIAQPMIGGIYVGDVSKLSAQSTVPQFVEMELTSGSVIGGLIRKRELEQTNSGDKGARYSMFLSLKNGMQELVEKLTNSISNVSYNFEKQLLSISKEDKKWILDFWGGEKRSYDAAILTLSPAVLKDSIKGLDESIASNLAKIPCASSAVVNLVYERKQTNYPFDAFGFVVPEKDNRAIIAASFSSAKFKGRCPEDKVIIRAFLGGVLADNILNQSDQSLVDIANSEVSDFLKIQGCPISSWLCRYNDSMPQYLIGHKNRVSQIMTQMAKYPGLALAGNSYYGVGIPDCINSANIAASSISDYLNQNIPESS